LSGLRVLDEDGRILNYLPNKEVEDALEDFRREDPVGFDRLIGHWGKAEYQICVVFPPESPFRAGQIRTVRFVHTDGKRPDYVKWSLLKLPSYNIEHERPRNHSHSLFVVVQAPQDTYLSVQVNDGEVRGEDHYYVTALDQIVYHFSAHLPAAKRKPYSWTATYNLGPPKVEQLILSLWWFLAVALGTWVITAFYYSQVPTLPVSGMTAVAAGATAATAALLLSLKSSWAERYRLALVPAFIVTVVAWILRA